VAFDRNRVYVTVFSLGGTIAMTRQSGGGVAPALTGANLIAAVPGLPETGIDVSAKDFRRVPGAWLNFPDILSLSAELNKAVRDGAAGVVITQGTDTIEETSFLLDLVYSADAPVVVTGAMRNPTLAGADGPANLLAAIQTAASPQARGLGCLVVFGDEIHAARYVRKVHSTSVAAFASPQAGPIGHVVEGEAHVLLRLPRMPTISRPDGDRVVRVALVNTTLGDDGELLRDVDQRFDGLVIAAFGAGHVPQGMVPILARLAERMPVVLASRTGAGSVLSRTYGFPGSESDLLARGLISAGLLDPLKARILLHLLLAGGAQHGDIAHGFAIAGGRQQGDDATESSRTDEEPAASSDNRSR
jgi:L-asparaginase